MLSAAVLLSSVHLLVVVQAQHPVLCSHVYTEKRVSKRTHSVDVYFSIYDVHFRARPYDSYVNELLPLHN
jgi:hypothetical protein